MAGLGAALMIARYLDRKTVTVTAPVDKIVVAAIDLPMATRLTAEHLKMVEWPVSALPPGAIKDLKDVVDRVLISHLIAGEPIRAPQLAAKDAGNGLAALIPQHMRAMAVRVDDVVGVAGFIHPDDRVDVIVTLRPPKPADAESTSKVILQNVKVLAVGKEIEVADQNRRQASPAAVATLLVSPEQAEKLALASNEGRLILTLRSWTDGAAVDTSGMNPTALLAEPGAAALAPIPAPVVAGAIAPSKQEPAPPPVLRTRKKKHKVASVGPEPEHVQPAKVEILRGDRFEERKFDHKGSK